MPTPVRTWTAALIWLVGCGPTVRGPADLRWSGCDELFDGACVVGPAATPRLWSMHPEQPQGDGWTSAPALSAWYRSWGPAAGTTTVTVPTEGGVRRGDARAVDALPPEVEPAISVDRATRVDARAGAATPADARKAAAELDAARLPGKAFMLRALAGSMLLEQGDYEAFEALLLEMEASTPPQLEAERALRRLQERLASRKGHIRDARALLQRALDLDAQLAPSPYRVALRADQLDLLLRSSDHGAALDAARATADAARSAPDSGACDAILSETNLGYVLWTAEQAGHDVGAWRTRNGFADADVDVHRRALAGAGSCRPAVRSLVATNLALALIRAGAVDEAAELLIAAQRDAAGLALLDNARGHALVHQARRQPAEALRAWGLMEAQAFRLDPVHGVLDALLGQAQAHTALGQVDEALAAHRRADAVAAAMAPLLPLHGGRDRFIAQREAATRDQVDLLLGRGRPDEALVVVRRLRRALVDDLAQARAADDPETRAAREDGLRRYLALRAEIEAESADAWTLSPEQLATWRAREARIFATISEMVDVRMPGGGPAGALRPPAAGVVRATWFPAAEGWRMFVEQDGSPVEVRTLLGGAAEGVAALRGLANGRPVLLQPWGPARLMHLHQVGTPRLIASNPVMWSLDLARPPAAPGAPGAAVLAADPRLDLPAARSEADAVAAALVGLPVQRLDGAAVTRSALVAAMQDAWLLHYAGHGEARRGDAEAALLLAGDDRLLLSDVLSARSVPRRVVLSGCETARTADTATESLGLGQAFVIAGSEAVVAAVSEVDDGVAAEMMRALYEAGFATDDPAVAFRRAALKVPSAGAFRLLVP